MEQNNNAETFEEIINLERIDVNLFRGRTPSNWPFPRIYGGQTMAQALRAAGFTVDPTFVVHSLHASFYLPGNTKVPILYNVERTRDGRSFVARRVIAVQNGDPIFSANISFQRPEEGVEHQDPIPPAPLPRDLPSYDAILEAVKSDPSLPSNAEQILRASFELPFPVDLRKVTDPFGKGALSGAPREPRELNWMRVRGKIQSNDPFIHACALTFMSDWGLLASAKLPHENNAFHQGRFSLSTLDHSMWFHDSFRGDQWLLADLSSTRARGGRGLTFSKFFTKEGKLVVSCAQEGVVRLIETKRKAKKDKDAAKALPSVASKL